MLGGTTHPVIGWSEAGDGRVFETQSLITATGQLSRPFRPPLPGLMNFSGPVFHCTEWREDYDLRGKCVAVVGTGASAIQLVPAIAPLVRKLYVFQAIRRLYLAETGQGVFSVAIVSVQALRSCIETEPNADIYAARQQTAFALITWRAALRVKRGAFFRHLRRGVKNPNCASD